MAIRPVNDKVTQKFGVKNSAYRLGYHAGTDYGSWSGTPIKATESGTVKYLSGINGGYGNVAELTLSNGDSIWHAHLAGRGKTGKVKQGDVIGYTGNTGMSTGPHLHVEYRIKGNQDRVKDFEKWLKERNEMVDKTTADVFYRLYLGTGVSSWGKKNAIGKMTPAQLQKHLISSEDFKKLVAEAKKGRVSLNVYPEAIRKALKVK